MVGSIVARWPATMITTVVQLDWLGFGQCNLALYIVEETLRYELLLWQWGQHLRLRNTSVKLPPWREGPRGLTEPRSG